jgi:hypothetical protein
MKSQVPRVFFEGMDPEPPCHALLEYINTPLYEFFQVMATTGFHLPVALRSLSPTSAEFQVLGQDYPPLPPGASQTEEAR